MKAVKKSLREFDALYGVVRVRPPRSNDEILQRLRGLLGECYPLCSIIYEDDWGYMVRCPGRLPRVLALEALRFVDDNAFDAHAMTMVQTG